MLHAKHLARLYLLIIAGLLVSSSESVGLAVKLQTGGQDAVWNSTAQHQITYCINADINANDGFGTDYAAVVAAMDTVTADWEAVADVDFIHLVGEDSNCTHTNPNVVFDVFWDSLGEPVMTSFYPDAGIRAAQHIRIDDEVFDVPGFLVWGLRHELGHALGFIHEHARSESSGICPEVVTHRALTDYDSSSVMHYSQCGGTGGNQLLSDSDKSGAACLYGAAPGFTIDPEICGGVGPVLDIDITRVALNAGTGTQNITFSNFSADCTAVTCAALFFVTTATADGTAAPDAMLGIGFTDGTTSYSWSSRSDHNVSATNTFRGQRGNTELIHTITFAGLEGFATFSAWLSNGIQISIDDDFAAQYLLTVVIIGGSSVSAHVDAFTPPALNTPADINTVGFEPGLVFLSGVRFVGTHDGGSEQYTLAFGVGVNDGSSTQGSIGCTEPDGASDGAPFAISSSLYALQFADDDLVGTAIEVGGWDAQGFSATTRVEASSGEVGYLALGIGALSSAVVDISTPTTTGSSSVSVGLHSLFGMILGTLAQGYDTTEADSDGGLCMIGMATAEAQYVVMNHTEDLASVTNTESISDDSFILMEQDDGSCNAGSCLTGTLTNFGETSWNLNYSSVFSGASRKWIGLAIEDPVPFVSPTTRRRSPALMFK